MAPRETHKFTEHGALNHVSLVRSRPIRIALYYALGGLIWVAVSDRVLSLMPAHSYTLNRLMFVGVNALLLYLVAARYMKTIRISVAARGRRWYARGATSSRQSRESFRPTATG